MTTALKNPTQASLILIAMVTATSVTLDFDNNLIVNAGDLGYLKLKFFTPDPLADLDGSGTVNAGDLAILKSFFFEAPGSRWPGTLI